MKYVPGVGGFPLMVANRALPDGSKKMSDAVPRGPKGGVVCCRAEPRERVFWSCAVNPFAWSTEKQVTPATAPPFKTQAATTISYIHIQRIFTFCSYQSLFMTNMQLIGGIRPEYLQGCQLAWDAMGLLCR